IRKEEFVEAVRNDPARLEAVMEAAAAIVDKERGYTIGDHYFGWEVDFNHNWKDRSKFGMHYLHFVSDLVPAYLITGDPLYVKAVESLFNQWYDQRNRIEMAKTGPGIKERDIVWYELGLGNRTPRLIDALQAMGESFSPETHVRMLKYFLGAGRWLSACLEQTPFHPYNWQTQTAMTLSYLGLLYPEFKEAGEWVQKGRENMILHFKKDILDDGGYIERTGSYTSYVFGMFYRYMLMFKYLERDSSLLDGYLSRLEKLMEFTSRNLTPLGVNAPFNDSRRSLGLARLLVDMAGFFDRGDFLGPLEGVFPAETLSRAGVDPSLPESTSELFPESHFAVMRDGWSRDAYYMIVNYGPFENHGHYDILDFECYANGVPIAVDAGIGDTGYVDPLHVSWYKQSRAHNMLMVDEANTMKRGIEGGDVHWSTQERMDYFAATHRGYERYHETLHRRHFAFRRGLYWLVVDVLQTPHAGKELDWHFHSPLALRETPDGFVSRRAPGVRLVLPKEAGDSIERLHRMGPANLKDLPGEPSNREIDWITFRQGSTGDRLKDRLAVLIYPTSEDSGEPAPELHWSQDPRDPDALMCRVVTETGEDVHYFSDGSQRQLGPVSGDFHYACLHLRDGVPQWVSVTGARRLAVGEQTLLSSETRTDGEWDLGAD
ncbi:MAG TPA: alginate lyase family protein, partial [Oceanipulchritudo sp.]|nr:alginate lyase family protein [Oceanipulchritudo sp.]